MSGVSLFIYFHCVFVFMGGGGCVAQSSHRDQRHFSFLLLVPGMELKLPDLTSSGASSVTPGVIVLVLS